MKTLPMQNHLKRHLLSVFVAAMAYNPDLTLAYLSENNILNEFFQQIFELTPTFKNNYERKVFIIGLSKVLSA